MPATGKITLDASDYKKTLEEVKQKTGLASEEMQRSVGNFGRSVTKASKAMNVFASSVGHEFGAVGKVIAAVASGPIAIMIGSLGALAAIGMKVFDQLTTSAEEYQAKMETQISVQEKAISSMRERQTEEDAYMERLKQLSTQESLSNAEKEEAAFLLKTLSGRYNDFSASIDEATGKITGLAEAEMKLNEIQKAQRIAALENAIESETSVSNAAFRNFAELPAWAKYTRGWFTGENADAEEAYKAYSGMTTQGKRETALEMLNSETGATTNKEIQFWKEELARLDKIIEKETELNNLRKVGTETVKAHAEEMKQASEAERKEIDSQAAAWKSFNDSRAKAEEDAERRAEEAARRDLDALKREENARRREQQSYRSTALKAAGYGARAAREEAVLAAEMRVGGPLDEDQYRKAVNFANAKFRLENFQFNAPQDFAPRVNSLVARGGSDAPVSMPKIEDLQAQTLTNVKTIKDLAARFLSAAEAWGTF